MQIAIRQMLAADHGHETQVLEKPQHGAFGAGIRGKLVYMPKRSCGDVLSIDDSIDKYIEEKGLHPSEN